AAGRKVSAGGAGGELQVRRQFSRCVRSDDEPLRTRGIVGTAPLGGSVPLGLPRTTRALFDDQAPPASRPMPGRERLVVVRSRSGRWRLVRCRSVASPAGSWVARPSSGSSLPPETTARVGDTIQAAGPQPERGAAVPVEGGDHRFSLRSAGIGQI